MTSFRAFFFFVGVLFPVFFQTLMADELVFFRNGGNMPIQNHELQAGRIRLQINQTDFMEVDAQWVDHFEPFTPEKKEESPAPAPQAAANRPAPLSLSQIQPAIREMAKKYQLDHKLITAMIRAESNFNPYAISPKGAQGLMQLMPETVQQLQVRNVFDFRENIEAGTRYLKQLLDTYQNDLSLALAAYNAGPSAVSLYRGIPPFPETRQYIQKVLYGRLQVQ
jgi:soluble lytic murein transglycosylase-like protein